MARQADVMVPHSTLKANLAAILEREGYLGGVENVTTPRPALRLQLQYTDGRPAIRNLKRISTPGRRYYVKHTELPKVLSGLGVAIISTSQGLMTNREARRQHLGGEVICEIY